MINLRPISLCNVIYKIITKMVANQFQRVLDRCIDPAQSAFVPRRLISDNVLLAYEMLHTFGPKTRGRQRYMALKVDMNKAYDRVKWEFLRAMMGKMGFAKGWVDIHNVCILYG